MERTPGSLHIFGQIKNTVYNLSDACLAPASAPKSKESIMNMSITNSRLSCYAVCLQKQFFDKLLGSAGILAALLLAHPVFAGPEPFDHQHALFTAVLENHVRWNAEGTATTVDYAALKAGPQTLDHYLQSLSAVTRKEFDSWTGDKQLAFLINAYNAFTLKLIIDNYPIESIKNIGRFWQKPWRIRFFRLLEEEMHLDQVEHEIIREPGKYDEPRIHFAVNCAAVGCPALRDRAFTADQLEKQLDDSTRRFLRDRSRNYFDADADVLHVSSIFRWYRDDFETAGTLSEWLARYADELAYKKQQRQRIKAGVPVKFLDYDWKLNERR